MLNRARRFVASLLLFSSAAFGAPETPEISVPPDVAEPAQPPQQHAKKKRKKKARSPSAKPHRSRALKVQHRAEPSFGVSYRSSGAIGFQHGYGVRRFDSPLLELRGALLPWKIFGPVRLELPLEYQQLNLPAGKLAEYRADGTLRATLRTWRVLQPFAGVEATAVWRPNWPDLYQPTAEGGLLPTDRFSYWRRRGDVGVLALPGKSTKLRAAFSYSLYDYRQDPAFRPVDEPNHLPPSDREELELKTSVSTTLGPLRPQLNASFWTRDYFFVFARDKLTGKTHAGPRGLPPNPLYATRGFEPELVLTLRLPIGSVRSAYSVQFVEDTFQGYYSSVEHHPSLALRWLASKSLTVDLSGELSLRRYGANSYVAGRSHPALTFGDRRQDQLKSVQLEASWKLSKEWTLLATGKLTTRNTNFPPYEPGVFPRSAQYDVQWNYDNWRLSAALQYRVRQLEAD